MIDTTLLVTGIHGLIGQYLVKILNTWKGKVVITGKGPCRLPLQFDEYVDMDITDPQQVNAVFKNYKPAYVIHLAALAQPDYCELHHNEAYLVNVISTENLLNASSQNSAFFLYMSSDFVFSGQHAPYHEEASAGPVNYYGQTKLLAENLVKTYGHPWAIVRTSLVYGNVLTGTRSNIISWVKAELESNKQIKVVADQIRTPTYAADLAASLLSILVNHAAGVWHISGYEALSPWQIAIAVADHLQLDKTLIIKVDSSSFSQPATRPLKTPLIIEKAMQDLNYSPVSFKQGMEAVLNGY